MKTLEMPQEPFIGCEEAGRILGKSRSTVWRMAKAGTIPCYTFPYTKQNNTHRFRVSELMAYINAARRGPQTARVAS